MTQPQGFDPDVDASLTLTAPEYAVLLDRMYAETAKAALTDAIARGQVGIVRTTVRSGLKKREESLLVPLPGAGDDLPPALAPVLKAFAAARRTRATDGTTGVTPKDWREAMAKSVGLVAYRTTVMAELQRKGLYAKRKTWYRLPLTELTPAGEAAKADAIRRAEDAGELVGTSERSSVLKEPEVFVLALAALYSLGPIALADPVLVMRMVALRADLSGSDGLPDGLGDLGALDGLDLSGLSAIDSAFDGGADGDGGGGGD